MKKWQAIIWTNDGLVYLGLDYILGHVYNRTQLYHLIVDTCK